MYVDDTQCTFPSMLAKGKTSNDKEADYLRIISYVARVIITETT